MKLSGVFRYIAIGIAALAALAGCNGFANQPGATGFVPAWSAAPAVKAFGVNLGDEAHASGTGGSRSMSFSHDWCNGAPGNPSGCYNEVPGKRKFIDAASGTVNLFNGTQPDGYTKAKIAATIKLGVASYTMYGEIDEKMKLLKNQGANAQIVGGDWDDTLYISSGSLKKGTPVTIGVQLALTPHTNVACDSAQNSFGELELYSPSVTPPSGNQFSISGGCVGGAFEYYLYNNTALKGTTAVGTIATAVGDSYPLYFAASGRVLACQSTSYCVGRIVASLTGNYKFTITSITPGAAYTTASGNTYK